jgi:hypothetical protein
VDVLAALDPLVNGGLRDNIVYNTTDACIKTEPDNTTINAEFIACIKSGNKRMITPKISYFYNRWQKDSQGPLDFQRNITSIDASGNEITVPTASGRFNIEIGTQADQRRLFFFGDENAHKQLLAEEAKVLPKLLVQYLR